MHSANVSNNIEDVQTDSPVPITLSLYCKQNIEHVLRNMKYDYVEEERDKKGLEMKTRG